MSRGRARPPLDRGWGGARGHGDLRAGGMPGTTGGSGRDGSSTGGSFGISGNPVSFSSPLLPPPAAAAAARDAAALSFRPLPSQVPSSRSAAIRMGTTSCRALAIVAVVPDCGLPVAEQLCYGYTPRGAATVSWIEPCECEWRRGFIIEQQGVSRSPGERVERRERGTGVLDSSCQAMAGVTRRRRRCMRWWRT